MLGQGVINGIVFGVENYAANHSNNNSTIIKHLKTGMVAGFIQSFVCSPMELVKLHTQHQKIGEKGPHQGNLEALKMIWQKEGMRGCYRGLIVTIVRDVSGFGVYFATYEGLMNALAEKQGISRDSVGVAAQFIFGGTAGVASWVCNYPVDVAKTGFQVDGANGTERQYKSSWHVIVKAWKEGGIRYLFPGFISAIVRAFAFSMFTFPAVEFVKRQLGQQQSDGV